LQVTGEGFEGTARTEASSKPGRTFVHLAGYYPLAPEDNYRRFHREYGRFLKAWSLEGTFGPMTTEPFWARWQIETRGRDWSTSTEHILFRWEDIIEADRNRRWPERLAMGWLTFIDFVVHGALHRYVRHAWRYAGFFLYPFILMAVLFAAGYFALQFGLSMAGLAIAGWQAALLAVPLLLVLLLLLGKPLKLDHLLDDWIYGRAITRRGDPAVEERLQALASHLNRSEAEVLIVGHSFGAVWGAELIRRMVAQRPEGPPIRFASVGASILKIGFHGKANPLRRALAAIAASPRLIWHDFNALNDVMNFHRIEPLAALGLPGRPPRLVNVRFRAMVNPEYYTRMQRNFFRLHNQFISGNDNRAAYDYFMLMCGPFTMEDLSSEDGATKWIDPAGGLTAEGRKRI
jgi:hypothetical protein